MCRKNKMRKYICSICGHRRLNSYYGYRHYDDIPLIPLDFELFDITCVWCGDETYYTVKK